MVGFTGKPQHKGSSIKEIIPSVVSVATQIAQLEENSKKSTSKIVQKHAAKRLTELQSQQLPAAEPDEAKKISNKIKTGRYPLPAWQDIKGMFRAASGDFDKANQAIDLSIELAETSPVMYPTIINYLGKLYDDKGFNTIQSSENKSIVPYIQGAIIRIKNSLKKAPAAEQSPNTHGTPQSPTEMCQQVFRELYAGAQTVVAAWGKIKPALTIHNHETVRKAACQVIPLLWEKASQSEQKEFAPIILESLSDIKANNKLYRIAQDIRSLTNTDAVDQQAADPLPLNDTTKPKSPVETCQQLFMELYTGAKTATEAWGKIQPAIGRDNNPDVRAAAVKVIPLLLEAASETERKTFAPEIISALEDIHSGHKLYGAAKEIRTVIKSDNNSKKTAAVKPKSNPIVQLWQKAKSLFVKAPMTNAQPPATTNSEPQDMPTNETPTNTTPQPTVPQANTVTVTCSVGTLKIRPNPAKPISIQYSGGILNIRPN